MILFFMFLYNEFQFVRKGSQYVGKKTVSMMCEKMCDKEKIKEAEKKGFLPSFTDWFKKKQ